MLLEPDQHRALSAFAEEQDKSVAEVTRQVIDLGLSAMETGKAFAKREEALRKADALRQAMRDQRGGPIEVDVVKDLREMRENRDEHILGRGD
jgi:hypothetical protein